MESITEYSHELPALIDRLEKVSPRHITNLDHMLRDQLVENVREPLLRWELKNRQTCIRVLHLTTFVTWPSSGQRRQTGAAGDVYVLPLMKSARHEKMVSVYAHDSSSNDNSEHWRGHHRTLRGLAGPPSNTKGLAGPPSNTKKTGGATIEHQEDWRGHHRPLRRLAGPPSNTKKTGGATIEH